MKAAVCVSLVTLLIVAADRAGATTFAERIVGGLSFPMFGTHAPNDASRLFVGRIWPGRIEIVDLATRTLLPEPFLMIDDLPEPLFNEQGLLGLAFDPNYATNGYFYVNSTASDDSVHIRRFRVQGDPATSNVADPASGVTLLRIPKQKWHNGGWIGFGPNDGYLYITIGDPGGGNAQVISSNLLGKVLRIDVHGDDFPADQERNYRIPATNPFVGRHGDDEIWAYGLRNPWQASFDRATGDLWINDVGESSREEVNFQPVESVGGENYGWWRREGSVAGPAPHGGPPLPEYTEPVYDYPRSGPDPQYVGTTIGASGVYRGPVDAFHGHYLFTDVGSGNIWKLDPDAVDRRASVTNINARLLPDAGQLNRVPAFGEDAAGNLYLMDYDVPGNEEVFRIATTSRAAVWNGGDSSAGVPGDGINWSNAANWTRDGAPDVAFIGDDHVVFAPPSSSAVIDLEATRTVSAVTFASSAELLNHELRVLSGNVAVEAGVRAVVRSDLVGESVHHSIRKLGSGTLVIEGDAGQVAVKGGTLAGSGTVDHLTVRSNAIVAPGADVGVLSVDNSLRMEPGATLAIAIGGVDNSDPEAAQFDQLTIGGTAQLAGRLTVELVNLGNGPFVPNLNDEFPVVTFGGGLSGSFHSLLLPPLPTGLVWQPMYCASAFILSVAHRMTGDFNGDFRVDAADYVVWRETQGQTGRQLAADASGAQGIPDGVVDEFDRLAWMANFGAVAAELNSAQSVPEPPAIFMAIVAASCLTARRAFGRRSPW